MTLIGSIRLSPVFLSLSTYALSVTVLYRPKAVVEHMDASF